MGGSAGTLARYGMSIWVQGQLGPWLPWGTLSVNVLGSFLLGFAVAGPVFRAAL
ncbi:MAG TPA: CrcB family protein [Longimicrobiaceae bacterium]|nr:CrcB family protein [Longimicrobiaceae bacterium]